MSLSCSQWKARAVTDRGWTASRLSRVLWGISLVLSWMGLPAVGAEQGPVSGPVSFSREIRPILSDNCFQCHGFDPKNRKAGRRLDTLEGAVAELDGVRALVPGDLKSSEMWQRMITSDEDELMPPPKSHKKLTEVQKQKIRRWIEEGAKYEGHWSFLPVGAVRVPEVKNQAWPRGEVDRFVLSRLEQEGMEASGEADAATLIRRVTLDLTGLPPTPEEVRAFCSDQSEGAYERLVKRLLDSPRYGERMAVEWMDAARYADTHGFNNDSARSMWRWRDWVIDSFNANLPYDRFITEQLAGDLLPQATVDQRIATGFCRNHVINSEGGIIKEEYRVEYVADRVRTMSTAWLGLTMECVRCHDHKFDPLTQKNYYSLFAFFNSVPEHGEDGRVANALPFMSSPTREQQSVLSEQARSLRELDGRLEAIRSKFGSGSESKLEPTSETPVDGIPKAKLSISCNDREPQKSVFNELKGGLDVTSGVVDGAWRFKGASPGAEWADTGADFGKAHTLAFWIRPDAENAADVAVLSNISYSGNRDQQSYGRGYEVRMIHGEVEVRLNSTYPMYALQVQSKGAGIRAGEWRHVAVVAGDGGRAAEVKIFVDGRRVACRVLCDGFIPENGKSGVRLALGGERTPGAVGFQGALDEVRFFKGRLSAEQVGWLFASQGLPYAQRRMSEGQLHGKEESWIREAGWIAAHREYGSLWKQREALWNEHLDFVAGVPSTMVMQEMGVRRATFVLRRGVYDARAEEVQPGVPELLVPWPEGAPLNRLGLARWLTRPDHPLTARVVVNRFWAQLFGAGLVRTLEDFGSQGEYPSHPELLDWLAKSFVEGGWNVKGLMRELVLSATYRQASRVLPVHLERDPENRLLARAPRQRLSAEAIRDQALAVSGLLKERIGGPSVFPYQPEGLYNGVVVGADYPGTKWEQSSGDDLFRRSLYTFWKRTVPHPVMLLFDAPDREFCTVRRSRTNTPLQALALMNERGFMEAAKQLGQRMASHEGGDEDRLRWGFKVMTSREPGVAELRELSGALEDARRNQMGEPFSIVGSILLNLDEALTRE
jgi:hypothetical protein